MPHLPASFRISKFLEEDDESIVLDPERLSDSAEKSKEDEYTWFMDNVKGLEEKELKALVAHRGFVPLASTLTFSSLSVIARTIAL